MEEYNEEIVYKRVTWWLILWKGLVRLWFGLIKFCLRMVALIVLALLVVNHLWGDTIREYYTQAKTLVESTTVESFRNSETSFIYDNDKKLIAKLRSDRDSTYLEYSEIPQDVIDCFVAIEDRRFYEHKGVDLQSTAKAAYLLLVNKGEITRGGSTITQQLVKNVFLTHERSYERKFKEMFIAWELEKKFSKEQILEFYINTIYYGNSYYGIESAAQGYFSKSVKKLSLEQIAFLCAIPNSPTYYDPLVSPENTKERQRSILFALSQEQPERAFECISALNKEVVIKTKKSKFHNYEESFAIDCCVKYLMKLNDFNFKYSFKSMEHYKRYKKKYDTAYDEAKNALYTGGYKIYTSIDSEVQKQLQSVVDETLSFSQDTVDGIYKIQGASTVIDNSTGCVIAAVGGRSQESIKENGINTLNRAFQMYKQPGSTIKPLVVYTPALDDKYNKYSSVNDSYFSGGPHNSNGSYSGWIPLYYAVEQSKNVVAWRLFSSLGPERCLGYMQAMHFSKIVPDDYTAAASLGGLTYGTTTVEMASGYCTIYNDGKFREPTCITSFLSADGEELYKKAKSKQVYTEWAARTMTDVLQGVIRNGTARGLALDGGMPAAAKTGTTDNQTNGWFCGYSPYYTVSVWVGTDGTESLYNLWGSTYPGQIWKTIQNYLNKDKKVVAFKKAGTKKVTTQAPTTTEVTTEAPTTTEPYVDLVIDPSENSFEYVIPDDTESSTEVSEVEVTEIPVTEVPVTEAPVTEDLTLYTELESSLGVYSALSFSSEDDVNTESSLYSQISNMISKIGDEEKRSYYQNRLDSLEINNEMKIQEYYSSLE